MINLINNLPRIKFSYFWIFDKWWVYFELTIFRLLLYFEWRDDAKLPPPKRPSSITFHSFSKWPRIDLRVQLGSKCYQAYHRSTIFKSTSQIKVKRPNYNVLSSLVSRKLFRHRYEMHYLGTVWPLNKRWYFLNISISLFIALLFNRSSTLYFTEKCFLKSSGSISVKCLHSFPPSSEPISLMNVTKMVKSFLNNQKENSALEYKVALRKGKGLFLLTNILKSNRREIYWNSWQNN